MLISPPILLPRNTGEPDDEWIERCMTGDAPGRGAYPLSYKLEWHGGLHLTAPRNGTNAADIRAVADGKVIHLGAQTVVDAAEEDHPLNYHHGYTSDACVVIEHTTEIGEGADARVTFYSVYHHLTDLSDQIALKKNIFRKDVIGHAGYIYGEKDRFHFEVCCDDDNLKKLTGRVTGPLSTAANGRADGVFGEIYFNVPAGAPVYAEQPVHYRSDGARQPPRPSASAPWPEIVAQVPGHTTTADVIIGLRYGGGEGSAPGGAALTTYLPDGSTIGALLSENDAEYNLYRSAIDINKAWRTAHAADAQQYPNVPAPSAIYELLRFGRIINAANETLTPVDAAHWRKVRHNGGEGWINLNAANVRQFSDADFPHWKGWQMIDDDCAATDSKCDSIKIRRILDAHGDGTVAPGEAETQLNDLTVQRRLKRTICKFPCEWKEATLEARWGWIKATTNENSKPYTKEEYEKLIDHLKALCFDCPALFAAEWRVEPREFIKVMRSCGWLTQTELAQCLPRFPGYTQSGEVRTALTSGAIDMSEAVTRTERYLAAFNLTMRKFGMANSRKRQAHFLAQMMLETDKWRTMKEYGSGAANAALPMTQYYSAFYGRGAMQLTWAGNYEAYGEFRAFPDETGHYVDPRITAASTHYWSDPTTRNAQGQIAGLDPNKPPKKWAPKYDPNCISSNPFNAIDSGAFYWVSKHHGGAININREADKDFLPDKIGRVSVLVNGGGNGYFERQAYAQYAYRTLNDDASSTTVVRFNTAKKNIKIDINFTKPN